MYTIWGGALYNTTMNSFDIFHLIGKYYCGRMNPCMEKYAYMEKQALSPEFIHRAVQAAAKRGFKKNLPMDLINKLKENGTIGKAYLEKSDPFNRYISGLKLVEKSLGKQEAIKILNHPTYSKATSAADKRILNIVGNKANTVSFTPGGKHGKTGEPIGFDRWRGIDDGHVFHYTRKYQDIYRAGKTPIAELKKYLKVPEEFNTLNTLRQVTSAGSMLKLKRSINKGYANNANNLVNALVQRQFENVPQGKYEFDVINKFIRNKPTEAKKAIVGSKLTPAQLEKINLPRIHASSIPGSSKYIVAEAGKDNARYWHGSNTIALSDTRQNPYTLAHEEAHALSNFIGNWDEAKYAVDPIPEEFFAGRNGRSILRRLAKATGLKNLPRIQSGTFHGLATYLQDDADFIKQLRGLPDNIRSQVYRKGISALNSVLDKNKINSYLHGRFEMRHNAPDYIGGYLKNLPEFPII